MRLILRLEALTDQAYDNDYNHYVQSFIYNLVKNSEFIHLHDFKGTSSTKEAITPFCFSNIFPYGDMKKGDRKSIIISSPNEKFIFLLSDKINRIDILRFGIYDITFPIGIFTQYITERIGDCGLASTLQIIPQFEVIYYSYSAKGHSERNESSEGFMEITTY
jgi:hypothetical protein